MPAKPSKYPQIKPIKTIRFVESSRWTELDPSRITTDLVGDKAFGLACIPEPWTLPFIVISHELHTEYKNSKENERKALLSGWENHITNALECLDVSENSRVIVRSSAQEEGLSERGKYHSVQGTLSSLSSTLDDCLNAIISDCDLGAEKVALIVQKYADPVSAKGHLSNERRCYEDGRDWLGEFDGGGIFTINFRNWRSPSVGGDGDVFPLRCNLSAHLKGALKVPAEWAYNQKVRVHFEWVWDGKQLYIVQVDQDVRSPGVDPYQQLNKAGNVISEFNPKVLRKINKEHALKFHKIRNVFTYFNLGLQTTNIYVLENKNIINDILNSKIDQNLYDDISVMVNRSLVIRLDIDSKIKKELQLLPRSDEIRNVDVAVEWLIQNAKKVKKETSGANIVFIFHNFIPAVASAFAYAAPGERKVRIEALWGLPEGLYYNSHDKYTVDTMNPRLTEISPEDVSSFEIQLTRNFKRYFVAPDENGHWAPMLLAQPYDWEGSIKDDNWVKKIAFESRRIANAEGKSLSVMWFVGVPPKFCPEPILPWFMRNLTHLSRAVLQLNAQKPLLIKH